ncbi:hypothetical protein DRJ04_01135 [Candidatus Aerophobetes bacterium]|uniref:Uncharacterized protein n=1 Tax=Aerophobetes bacterium TaxID=2030807 RepID=A0A662DLU1_UNCAE|nr:MAG: hypothetical protein DRJ04_01135 [Candidatus Aerophobetes bacterium]
MSNLGVIASKFNINSKSLREFDEALRFMKKEREIKRTSETVDVINRLLRVINPIADRIKEKLSESTVITERSVIDIIKERHSRDWPDYRENILKLESKLGYDKFQLSEVDFQILNDVADALDAECANLFHRMGKGR